ncbi:tubby C-terminal domain-like protein [Shouchella shacheensis]|uniref:tubby C-terminal domain-like protein n=1 Tax=Shouchella shacheensis TaxID=1649580 RepID=UPI0007400D93|nr:hypothetical protein [Shouchella shacheensis]
MVKYDFKEHMSDFKENELTVNDENGLEAMKLSLFYKSKLEEIGTRYFGVLTRGLSRKFNIKAETPDVEFLFCQQPIRKNLVHTKWDIYKDQKQIGVLSTVMEIKNQIKMHVILSDEEQMTFQKARYSKETTGWVDGQNVFRANSSLFNLAQEHTVELQPDQDPVFAIGAFHVLQTFLSTR